MTGTSLLANYGKFLTCLTLALVPGVFAGGLLLDDLRGWPWRLPPEWAGLIGVTACAFLSTSLFGLAMRSGPGMSRRVPLQVVALAVCAALLPFLPGLSWIGLRQMHLPLIAAAVFLAVIYPVCILFGTRQVSWGRVSGAGLTAFAATLGGMLYVLWVDRSAMDVVLRLLLIALATLGFLPFARIGRGV